MWLLLDASRSMAAGAPPKFDLARRAAAALGCLALAGGDRTGVLAFAGGAAVESPPVRGAGAAPALLRTSSDSRRTAGRRTWRGSSNNS